MNIEIEATFLNANHDEIRKQLKAMGGTCVQPLHTMKRAIYDYPDLRLDKQAAWIRVREEANKITMSYKQRQSETIEGMREVEFTISDYEKGRDFLEAIGLTTKAVQESKREVWEFEGCEVMLDEWPWIPTYVEVEGPKEASVRAASEKLGFDYTQAVFDSTDAIYQKYFDVTRTEISTVPLTFGVIPDWLEAKRR
jgi:adenylate cyclase class 2